MAALLGTNLHGANSSNAAAIASLLTQQQKHGGLFGKSNMNSLAGLSPLHGTQKTNADYLTNHLNDKLNSPDGHKDGLQFRDNLLSTGSTNYLSNASSSSASSSPLISLCGQTATFQNASNQRAGQFNYNKPDYHKTDYGKIDYNKLDLYGQFNSPSHGAPTGSAPSSNQSLNSFAFDQFKNKNSSPSADKPNASTKLNSSIPSALSYLSNLNSLNNYSSLAGLGNRLGSPDWLARTGQQLSSPLSQLSSNGQLNQLFAQFELERLTTRNNDPPPSNKSAGAFSNGDEVRNKKFKADDSAKRDEEYRQFNGLLRKDGLAKKFGSSKVGKTKALNDENRKSEERLKNGTPDDCEFDEDDENLEELDEKKNAFVSLLPNGSTSALDLIKLGDLLNNPTAIFETLNQLSLTNPQMASAFALSLLGQLDQTANPKSAGAEKEDAGHLPAGSRSQCNQLGSPAKRSSADEQTENKLRTIGQFIFETEIARSPVVHFRFLHAIS